jgi:hypothetical protein
MDRSRWSTHSWGCFSLARMGGGTMCHAGTCATGTTPNGVTFLSRGRSPAKNSRTKGAAPKPTYLWRILRPFNHHDTCGIPYNAGRYQWQLYTRHVGRTNPLAKPIPANQSGSSNLKLAAAACPISLPPMGSPCLSCLPPPFYLFPPVSSSLGSLPLSISPTTLSWSSGGL